VLAVCINEITSQTKSSSNLDIYIIKLSYLLEVYLNSKASITCVSLDRLKFLITYLLEGLLLFLKLREREVETNKNNQLIDERTP